MTWTLTASGTKTATVGSAPFALTAGASFTTASTTITLAAATDIDRILPGMTVYDVTAVGVVGTVSSVTALTITLVAASLINSSGAADALVVYYASCAISIAGPAVVTLANTCAAGDQVVFSTTGALPTGIAAGTIYYVIAAGLSGSQFEFSATPGGTAVVTSGTQSGVQTASIGHLLVSSATNATFVFEADLSALANGDMAELQLMTTTLAGGTSQVAWEGFFRNAQISGHKVSPPVASDQQVQAFLWQFSAQTGRGFPWKLLSI